MSSRVQSLAADAVGVAERRQKPLSGTSGQLPGRTFCWSLVLQNPTEPNAQTDGERLNGAPEFTFLFLLPNRDGVESIQNGFHPAKMRIHRDDGPHLYPRASEAPADMRRRRYRVDTPPSAAQTENQQLSRNKGAPRSPNEDFSKRCQRHGSDLWITGSDLWITGSDLWITRSDLWITGSDLWITGSDLWITRSDLWITGKKQQLAFGRMVTKDMAPAGGAPYPPPPAGGTLPQSRVGRGKRGNEG
ncbi:uncharacterized protein LOC129360630 [Poeciliopsis prolifica]|uniref:uncharacterized protein LOC129360630 n=1 Tax=Poeciliopsis prolifica TaxID=188132 RepID=UPI0024138FA5|nr:uncharacterized protein LOC129360630 [Poeciliopsis prolifica]